MDETTIQKMWDSIVYYRRWSELLVGMEPDLRHAIHDAIDNYLVYGTLPTDTLVRYGAFACIHQQILIDKAKYEDIRDKRSKAGKMHKGNQYSKMEQMEHNGTNGTNGTDNVNDNVNVSIKRNISKEKAKAELTEDELNFETGMKKDYPRVMKMKEPLTLAQWTKLREQHDKQRLIDALARMDNYEQLLKNKHSAYKTLLDWVKRDEQR